MAGSVPEEFRIHFWDTDFDALDLERNKLFIISRLYCRGDIPEIVWLHKTFSDEDVVEAAQKRRDFDPVTANYLRQMYGLQKADMRYYTMPHCDWRNP